MNIDKLSQLSLNTLKKPVEKPAAEVKRPADAKQTPATDTFEKINAPESDTDVTQIVRFATEAPDIRIEKIEEVRAKIAQGVYDFQKTQEDIAASLAAFLK